MTPAGRLRHVAELAVSNVDKKAVDGEVPVRLCNYVDVYYNDHITDAVPFMDATATADQVHRFTLRAGDVLFTKDSETADDIAVPAFVPADLPGVVCGYHLAVARPRPSMVDGRYLFWVFASKPARDHFAVAATGVTRYGLRQDLIGDLPVRLPTLGEQRAIADFLDTETARIDALITKKRRLIELLDERRDRSLDRVAFGTTISVDRSAPSDVPRPEEIPNGWRSVAIGHLLSRITYGFTNPMPQSDEGPFLLTANDIQDNGVAYETARRTTEQAFRTLLTAKSRPRKGDVLLTKDGTLGRCTLFDGPPSCVNQSVAVLTPRQDVIDPGLLALLLIVPAYRAALIHAAGGTTIKHLYISRVVKQRLAIPDRDHQAALRDRLADVIAQHRALVERLQSQIDLLVEHRQALITAAVTGELPVGVAG